MGKSENKDFFKHTRESPISTTFLTVTKGEKQLRPGAHFCTFLIVGWARGGHPPTPLIYFFSGVSGISIFRKKNNSRGGGVAAPRPSLQSKKSEKGGPGRNCFSPLLTVKKVGEMG